MPSILIEDFKNKVYQEAIGLSEEKELHIRNNIIILNAVEFKYIVYYLEVNNSKADLEKKGYKIDNSIYDKAIIEYNCDSSKTGSLLKAWIA